MEKVALLIGMSEYEPGLNLLPGAVKDVESMQRVLDHRDMGGFDQVKALINPDLEKMQAEIETIFSERAKDDLVLLFFSGHGAIDESRNLYFATRSTRKNAKGDFSKATAVSAHFVQEIMNQSPCKQQVVILDCCFSGAFANTMLAKTGDQISEQVNVQSQLCGEGRAVLTSSTASQYSFFDQQTSDLSIYTRYLVEGIETGAADIDGDGLISVIELHEYAQKKVHAAAPAMKPKIFPVGEGFKIVVATAPVCDARLMYRREAERLASQGEIADEGKFSFVARNILNILRETWMLALDDANIIETEVLKPYQEYRGKLKQYRRIFQTVVEDSPAISTGTRRNLIRLCDILNLRSTDVEPIETELLQQYISESVPKPMEPTEVIAPRILPSLPVPKASRYITKYAKKRSPLKHLANQSLLVSISSLTTVIAMTMYLGVDPGVLLPESFKVSLRKGCDTADVFSVCVNFPVHPTPTSSPFILQTKALYQAKAIQHSIRAEQLAQQAIASQSRDAELKTWRATVREWREAIALLEQEVASIDSIPFAEPGREPVPTSLRELLASFHRHKQDAEDRFQLAQVK